MCASPFTWERNSTPALDYLPQPVQTEHLEAARNPSESPAARARSILASRSPQQIRGWPLPDLLHSIRVLVGRLRLGFQHPAMSPHSRSIAAFTPSSTSFKTSGASAPILFVIFARSNVVTWWQTAKLVLGSPALPPGISTTVGPRFPCDAEVEIGTTIIDLHAGVWLKPSWDITITGRRPVCSEPDRGTRSAQ